jgi:ribonuclease HII
LLARSERGYAFDAGCRAQAGGDIVGLDEAGRGPLAGPVLAAAVILDPSDPIDGVGDSKAIAPRRRDALYETITNRALAWAVAEVDPATIDVINILQASLLAMRRALDQIGKPWVLALVDGNQPIPSLAPDRQMTVVKGDAKSAAIGAASILAKVTRDRIMAGYHGQYPEYGFDRHKGYPTLEHREQILKHGLSPIHRKSFCVNLISQTVLSF